MERRDFLGAALALFTWTVLPEPVREVVWVQDPWMPPDTLLISEDVMKKMMSSYMNLQLYPPRGAGVILTDIREPAHQEYAQWWAEQQ